MKRIKCQRLRDRIRKLNNRLKASVSLANDAGLQASVSLANDGHLEKSAAAVIVAAREVVEEYYRAVEQVTEEGYPSNWEDWEYYKEHAQGHLHRLGAAA
jgi:hypothetical protein